MEFNLIPKTPEGWTALQHTLVGVIVATLMGGMFIAGLVTGYNMGLNH